jgi:predicted extracellular nuclease
MTIKRTSSYLRPLWLFAWMISNVALSSSAQSRSNQLNVLDDPRGPPELVVCSQNLQNYGTWDQVNGRGSSPTPEALRLKERDLVARFVRARCDVIAAQEILGVDMQKGTKSLEALAKALQLGTGRFWEVRLGASLDKTLHTGMLVARDRAEIVSTLSYENVELPKTSEKQKPRLFRRAPIEVQLLVKGRGESSSKSVTIVNFHFKSKSGSKDDPAALEWETYRMEMAEALRRIVENRHARSFGSGESILVLLGDRNSNFDAASAKILEGALTLKNFQSGGTCRLSKRGAPLCQAAAQLPQRLFSVLTTDPQTKGHPGTYLYKNIYSWLDDILLPAESLPFAWRAFDSEGDYASGVLSDPPDASDHALVWTALNW